VLLLLTIYCLCPEIFARKLPHLLPISGYLGWNIDYLKARIWEYMELTRIYTKPKGSMPDFTAPGIQSYPKP
jgi:ribosome-interacting GTPase 1